MGDVLIESTLTQKSPLLKKLQEGNKLWTSEENVQLWINNISESEFPTKSSEASSPTKNSFDSDVFLQLPGDGDDLVLGAEAKHYGHLSPCLSPLVSFDKDDKEMDQLCDIVAPMIFDFHPSPQHDQTDNDNTFDPNNVIDLLLKQKQQQTIDNDDTPFFLPEPSYPPKKSHHPHHAVDFSGSLDSQDTYSSWASSFDRPSSLAAALQLDPEELLFNIGFCDQNSLLQTIPERFFLNQSEAFGINVTEIHTSLLVDDEAESIISEKPTSSNHVLQRFSESSIDLQSITSSESTNLLSAKSRRILFKSSRKDIPSIHLTRDEERPESPTSASTSTSGTNWMKLETLEEVPEPNSRGSSFELDKVSSNSFSSLMNAAMLNVGNKLEHSQQELDPQRKLSDTNVSRGGTLVEDDDTRLNDDARLQPNSSSVDSDSTHNPFVGNSLKAPVTYTRSYSDKSISSVVTVIDRNSLSIDKNKNELVQHDSITSFKPISDSCDSVKENMNITEESANGRVSPSLSAANRRSLFGSSKKDRSKKEKHSNDNVFQSNDSAKNKSVETLNKDENTVTENLNQQLTVTGTLDINDIRRASLNDSFRDFIKQLTTEPKTQESPSEETMITPNIEILVNSPVPSVPEGELDNDSTNDKKDNASSTPSSNEDIPDIKPNTNLPPQKKGYFSAAIDSISSVFNKYQDSKQSKSSDDVRDENGETLSKYNTSEPPSSPSNLKSTPSSPSKSKSTSSLFRLFNHQTLSVHSNSAFSTFVSSIANGEVDLDQSSEHDDGSIFSNKSKTRLLDTQQASKSSKNNNRNDLSAVSDSSINDRHRSTSRGYVADSPISSDDIPCYCPTSNNTVGNKRKSKNPKKISKGRSIESSGFDEDQRDIKCPLGKNCSLQHKNGRHVYPTSRECDVCSGNRLAVKTETNSRITSNVIEGRARTPSNTSSVVSHEHFDYLVQQLTSIRGEMKEEFQQSAVRENDIKVYFADQIEEMKKVIASEYMGWVVKEMQQLKGKLQEKDEEIRRLRDVISSVEQSPEELQGSPFGTEV